MRPDPESTGQVARTVAGAEAHLVGHPAFSPEKRCHLGWHRAASEIVSRASSYPKEWIMSPVPDHPWARRHGRKGDAGERARGTTHHGSNA
jgi:hypothetical protein